MFSLDIDLIILMFYTAVFTGAITCFIKRRGGGTGLPTKDESVKTT